MQIHSSWQRTLVVLLALSLTGLAAGVSAAPRPPPMEQMLIAFDDEVDAGLLAHHGAVVKRHLGHGTALVEAPAGLAVALQHQPGFLYATPNQPLRLDSTSWDGTGWDGTGW